ACLCREAGGAAVRQAWSADCEHPVASRESRGSRRAAACGTQSFGTNRTCCSSRGGCAGGTTRVCSGRPESLEGTGVRKKTRSAQGALWMIVKSFLLEGGI